MWTFLTLIALAADPVLEGDEDPNVVEIARGKSVVIAFDEAPTALSVTDESIALAVKLGDDNTWQIQGLIGETDMAVIVKGKVELYDLTVQRDVSGLQKAVRRITRDQ